MPTQARLSFWIATAHEPSFREVLSTRLAPLLARHGLTTSSNCPRPSLPGILSQLYELPDPTAVRATARALAQDPDWQAEMLSLGAQFSPPSPAGGSSPGSAAASLAPAGTLSSRTATPSSSASPPLRWTLGLFSTPATPSRTVPAGPGTRRGLWHSFGLADGMLSPVINQLLQDRSGYLWLSTGDGLSRFDGGEFRHFTAADGLPHNSLNALIETPDQALWIGSNGHFAFARAGLCRYDGYTFSHYTEADGLPSDGILSLWVTAAGTLWVSTIRGVCYYKGERFHPAGPEHGPAPRAVVHTSTVQGRHWLATEYGACFFDGEIFQPIPPDQSGLPGVVWSCFEDRQGRLWLGGREGLRCREEEVWTTFDVAAAIPGGRGAAALGQDREGGLWFVAYPQGVFRLHQGRTTAWGVAEGLPSGRVLFGRFDRQEQLWLATDGGGIARYHGAGCRHFTRQDGLPGDSLTVLELDRRGRVWVGGDRGLVCRAGQEWQSVVATENWSTAPVALLEDHQGTLWAVTHGGAVQHRLKGEWTTLLPPPVQTWNCGSLAQAKDLSIWAANGSAAVYRFAGGECITFAVAEGVPPGQVRRLHAETTVNRVWLGTILGVVGCWEQDAFRLLTDGSPWGGHCVLDLFVDRQERLWIGTEGGGVACFDGQDLRVYTTAAGLAANRVMRIAQVRAGHLLFATQGGGVSLWDGEVFQTLTAQDGLTCDAVRDLLEDRQGAYWFATEYGLTRYRSGSQPPAIRLTEVLADRPYDLTRPIAIPVSHRFVRFCFAAASLTQRGAAMVYRYRLDGSDTDWQATRDAQVTYHSLALGLYTFHVQAIDPDLLHSAPLALTVEIVADPRAEAVAEAFRQASPQEEMVGNSPAMQALQDQVQQAAQTDLTVLLTGETGTGKAVVARLVHDRGLGPAAPFITVNCGSADQALFASELLGHERGAFTGAERYRTGKVELARHGTLFLDEIGDIPDELQARLLHLLEEGTYEPLGNNEPRPAQVRVIAATNRDLPAQVQQGRFRQDLYYRLTGYPIHLPPLRDRTGDIPLLVTYFLRQFAAKYGCTVPPPTPTALDALQAHPWPGNVRELRKVLERAAAACRDRTIDVADLHFPPSLPDLDHGASWVAESRARYDAHAAPAPAPQTLEQREREHILQVLEQTGWRVRGAQGAAARLGLKESSLRARLRRYGIGRPQ